MFVYRALADAPSVCRSSSSRREGHFKLSNVQNSHFRRFDRVVSYCPFNVLSLRLSDGCKHISWRRRFSVADALIKSIQYMS